MYGCIGGGVYTTAHKWKEKNEIESNIIKACIHRKDVNSFDWIWFYA